MLRPVDACRPGGAAARGGPVDRTLEVVDAWTLEVAVPGEAPAVHEGVVRSDWRWFEAEDGVRWQARIWMPPAP